MSFWQDFGALFTPTEKTKLAGVDTGATDDQTGAEIKALYEVEVNAYTDTKNTKLANIETGATTDQTNNEIRDAVEAATDSNTFTNADHTKLNGVDTGATDDQTGAEIKTAYEGQANAYTDTKNTKLSGIETGADVTDTSGILAAGSKNQINLWRVYVSPGSDVAVGTIPAHSFIHRVWVHVTELFNDSGTDILTVGTAGDHDRFGTSLDVSSTGITEMVAGVGIGYNSAEQAVTARYSCQNYNVNQGKALVIVEYEAVGAQP